MTAPNATLGVRFGRALLAAAWIMALAACGGSDDGPPPPPPVVGSATVGAAGGTVDGPDGVRLVVPAGALEADVTFRVARDDTGAPLLEGLNAVSPIYAVTPHGQVFGAQAVLSIPLAAATRLPAGVTPMLLKVDRAAHGASSAAAAAIRRAWRPTSTACRSSC